MHYPELSNNCSFYRLACHTTDIFTSCIKIYEDLLSCFETERRDDSCVYRKCVYRRLMDVDDMLTLLYEELTFLKSEMVTAVHDEVLEPSTECKAVKEVLSECYQQDNIIAEVNETELNLSYKKDVLTNSQNQSVECEDVTEVVTKLNKQENTTHEANQTGKNASCNEEVLKNSPKQSVECKDITKVVTEHYTQEVIPHEANETKQNVSYSEALQNSQKQSTESKDVTEAVGEHYQKENISHVDKKREQIVLHVEKEFIKAIEKLKKVQTVPDPVYGGGGGSAFSCIKPSGNGFKCTICNKKLSGPKVIVEHVRGNSHKMLSNEFGYEIPQNTDHGMLSTNAQVIWGYEKNLAASVVQKESLPPQNFQRDVIKSLSGSLYRQRQYLSWENFVLTCNLCDCQIPPTVQNVRDHVLGSRHSRNEAALQSPT